MLILRTHKDRIVPEYIFVLVQTNEVQQQFKQILSGCAQPQLPIRSLVEVEIPLPPLDVQRRIVAELEAERTLVESNRKLIEVFEKKIQSKLAEIWEEGERATV